MTVPVTETVCASEWEPFLSTMEVRQALIVGRMRCMHHAGGVTPRASPRRQFLAGRACAIATHAKKARTVCTVRAL